MAWCEQYVRRQVTVSDKTSHSKAIPRIKHLSEYKTYYYAIYAV